MIKKAQYFSYNHNYLYDYVNNTKKFVFLLYIIFYQ